MRVVLKKGQCISTLRGLNYENQIKILWIKLRKINFNVPNFSINDGTIVNYNEDIKDPIQYLYECKHITKYERELLKDERLKKDTDYRIFHVEWV